jgi:hypothetical protein
VYCVTLKRPWDVAEVLPMSKAPQTLPIILTKQHLRLPELRSTGLGHRA